MVQLQPPQLASGTSVVPQNDQGAQFLTQTYGWQQNSEGPQLIWPGQQINGRPQINGGPQNSEGLQLLVQRQVSTGEKIRRWANTFFRFVNAVTNVVDFVADYF